MPRRALIALAVLLFCAPSANAEWHAVAEPPRAGLPIVEVDLGYPGGYVSITGSPIRLRARSGEMAFDGYIGFEMRIRGLGASDDSVISRAVLAPRSEWRFTNWVDVAPSGHPRLDNRELVIEWRDRRLNRIATQAVGVPPWSFARPLRITADGETVADNTYLGEAAVVLPQSALSDQPQWYTGFSSVVVPTALWLSLPTRVRETIFRTPLQVHFFGAPPQTSLSKIDAALLPIERRGQRWEAKTGANVLGSRSSPSLAVSSAASYAATEELLRAPLPSFARSKEGRWEEPIAFRKSWPRPGEILREYRPAVMFAAAVLSGIIAWLTLRRGSPKTPLVVFPVLIALALVFAGVREWIRPAAGMHLYTGMTMPAPGVTDVHTVVYDYGPAPRIVPAAVRSSLAGKITDEDSFFDAEVRDSDTSPGLGKTVGGVWKSTVRFANHRELSTPAVIRIISKSEKELVLDFEADRPIEYVAVWWRWNGKRCQGESRVGSRSRGRATIRDRHDLSRNIWRFPWRSRDLSDRYTSRLSYSGATRVVLFDVDRDRTTTIEHIEHAEDVSPRPPYTIQARLRPGPNGVRSREIVFPAAVPANARASFGLSQTGPYDLQRLTTMTLEGQGGTATVDIRGLGIDKRREIPVSALRRVAPAGGLVKLTIDPASSGADLSRTVAYLSITEEKP